MDIVKELENLEDKYYGEWEENKESLIGALEPIHKELLEDREQFNRFLVQTAERFGGAYIPHLFFHKLSEFLDTPEERAYLQELIRVFAESNFEEEEQKKLKPLLVVYFAKEKEFEHGKLKTMYFDKAHPEVREYFMRLLNFTQKNKKATEMYIEKFDLLKGIFPDFHLLGLPITQLREKF